MVLTDVRVVDPVVVFKGVGYMKPPALGIFKEHVFHEYSGKVV